MASILIRTFLRPAGLKNKGNTCFFNATIQCVLSLPGLISYLKRMSFDDKKQPVTSALQAFMYEYQAEKIVDPQAFIKSLKKKIKLFDGQQQDAHSFLESFLDLMIQENKPNANVQEALSDGPNSTHQNKENSAAEEENKLKNMFNVLSEDLIKCQACGFHKKVENTAEILYLFIDKDTQKSIDNLQTNGDIIDKDSPWECPKCHKKSQPTIYHKIVKTPQYLIIHLNRFLNAYSKNYGSININEEININGETFQNTGVVCHSGNLCGGHYYSKAKRDDDWYEFNDSMAARTSRTFESSQPYLLFYSKK
jgi:ubiquitin carboxyl-terminal hydrolase 21